MSMDLIIYSRLLISKACNNLFVTCLIVIIRYLKITIHLVKYWKPDFESRVLL